MQRQSSACWRATAQCAAGTLRGVLATLSAGDAPEHRRARSMLLCVVKGRFGGAGRPVMGHSCEGRLLSSHALPSEMGAGDGPADRSKDNRVGVRQLSGQARHRGRASVAAEVLVDLAGDVTLQDPDDLGL
jgi:hypothetical protein